METVWLNGTSAQKIDVSDPQMRRSPHVRPVLYCAVEIDPTLDERLEVQTRLRCHVVDQTSLPIE
jgi:hypothetical protein